MTISPRKFSIAKLLKIRIKKKRFKLFVAFVESHTQENKMEILGFYNGFEFVCQKFAQLVNFDGIQPEKTFSIFFNNMMYLSVSTLNYYASNMLHAIIKIF